ncbi:MAG: c-type cytochrome [Parvularculaceae bacterium]|nr:c-type cytochrome [Parvularculaceae bacterium]
MNDPMFFNKLAAAVLVALLLFFGLPQLAIALRGGGHHAGEGHELKLAYPIEFAAEGGHGAEAKPVADLGTLLAAASAAGGERRAALCKSCHTFDKGGTDGTGPNLWGIVDRPVASHAGFNYTGAVKAAGGVWSYDRLDKYLENSAAYIPGTAMAQRFAKPEQRADILAFLQTLSDAPVAFPTPAAPAEAVDGESGDAAGEEHANAGTLDEQIQPYLDGIEPVAGAPEIAKKKVELGELLYHDTRLSGDGSISCATCHALATGGVDGLTVSTGIRSAQGPINAPTVYNSAHNFVQFWDGRAATLEEQAGGPVENPLEMGADWDSVVVVLNQDADLVAQFQDAYGVGISKESVTTAIADFERTLATPNAPFDKYLRGDKAAISDDAKRGFLVFAESGCATCHTGSYFGGEAYQVLAAGFFEERGGAMTDADHGRVNVTGDNADERKFKVPMLRNAAVTAPYFHDGSAANLEDAGKRMARHQLGLELSDDDAKAVAAFITSLTGEYNGVPLHEMATQ